MDWGNCLGTSRTSYRLAELVAYGLGGTGFRDTNDSSESSRHLF